MNPALRFTIITSLLLHALLYWGFNADLSALFQPPEPKEEYSLEFDLAPQPKPAVKKPSANQPPPPRHLEDDINKSNTSDGIAETGSKTPNQKVQKKAEITPEPQQATKSDNPNLLSSFLRQKASSPNEQDDQVTQKGAQEKLDEEKARWYNEVLKRISAQVHFQWVKPQGIPHNTWGVIYLKINERGYLKDAWVHLPSGNFRLDQSALRAIRGVQRFEIPHADKLNRYYRHLEFRYHG